MSPAGGESEPLDSRRAFLRRALRGGAYIPPTIVAMSMRNVAVAQSTCPGKGKCGGGQGCQGGGQGCNNPPP